MSERDPHAMLIAVAAALARRCFTPDYEGLRINARLRRQLREMDDQQGRLAATVRDAADELAGRGGAPR